MSLSSKKSMVMKRRCLPTSSDGCRAGKFFALRAVSWTVLEIMVQEAL